MDTVKQRRPPWFSLLSYFLINYNCQSSSSVLTTFFQFCSVPFVEEKKNIFWVCQHFLKLFWSCCHFIQSDWRTEVICEGHTILSPENSEVKAGHTSTSASGAGDFQIGQSIFRENDTILLGLSSIRPTLGDKNTPCWKFCLCYQNTNIHNNIWMQTCTTPHRKTAKDVCKITEHIIPDSIFIGWNLCQIFNEKILSASLTLCFKV